MLRAIVFFAAGAVVGLTAQGTIAQGRNEVALNHVGIAVPDVNAAVAFYTQKMGFREAFRGQPDPATGRPGLVYLQISRNTFLEVQSVTPQRPAGISHLGLEVGNMQETVARLRQQGVTVTDPTVSVNSKAILANATDLAGNRVELGELTPDSLQRRAINAWK